MDSSQCLLFQQVSPLLYNLVTNYEFITNITSNSVSVVLKGRVTTPRINYQVDYGVRRVLAFQSRHGPPKGY